MRVWVICIESMHTDINGHTVTLMEPLPILAGQGYLLPSGQFNGQRNLVLSRYGGIFSSFCVLSMVPKRGSASIEANDFRVIDTLLAGVVMR